MKPCPKWMRRYGNQEETIMSKETLNKNLGENQTQNQTLGAHLETAALEQNAGSADGYLNLEARLLSSEDFSSLLPSLSFAAAAAFSRDGNDLVLTLDGETVVVKNYFATPNPPVLTTADGAVLTPEMIASFLQPGLEQDSYASSLLNKLLGGDKPLDSDAVAVVENLKGTVLAIRKGEAVTLQEGDQLFQGDQISTAPDSSANMIFADGTRFNIGGEARIALDQFSFESSTSQGLQVLSILSGAFSYVSGLVAKNDPANVHLRTPVGEIGIRGTKIVGEVDAENAAASITLLEGRILYRTPQGEEHEISQGFETLNIKNGGESVKESTISAERAARSYDVFEDAGEVSNFLQQQPATQQDTGSGATQSNAVVGEPETPLPDISYSQAQAERNAQEYLQTQTELITLVESNARNSLERISVDEELIEQIVSIELQRAEVLRETLGKDQTDDKSLIASNTDISGDTNTGTSNGDTGSGSGETRGGDDNFNINLATLDGKVFVGFGTGGGATYDTLNFRLEDNIDSLVLTFAKGLYVAGNANSDSTFTFQEGSSDFQELSWRFGDQVAGSLSGSPYDSPPDGSDDLMITATFDSDGDGIDEVFRIVFDEYFPTRQDHVLPTYSISLNGEDATKLENYNPQIEELLPS